MSRSSVRSVVIGGLVLLALSLVGCATNAPTGGASALIADVSASPSLAPASAVHAVDASPSPIRGTVEELAFLDVSAVVDQSFYDMRTVAESAQAVAIGRINRWLAGDKIRTDTGMSVGAAILAEFSVEKIVQAKEGINLRVGDTIYLPSPGSMDIGELAQHAPKDLQALVYLGNELSAEQLVVGEPYVVEKGDPAAAGAPRWILQSSQGLVVVDQYEPELLVWPALGNVAVGTLEDALPGGRLDGLTELQRPKG